MLHFRFPLEVFALSVLAPLSFGVQQESFLEEAELVATLPVAGDHFGSEVALSGDTLLVGAFQTFAPGSAHVFVRDGTGWNAEDSFQASDAWPNDKFGSALSVFGDVAVIGAYGRDDVCPLGDPLCDSGAVYVFERRDTFWTEQQKILPASSADAGRFGISVSVWGDTFVAGAPGARAAYVFVHDGTTWSLQQRLEALPNSFFGDSVSIMGETILVGGGGNVAHVFVRSGTTWSLQQTLSASDGDPSDAFGARVAVWEDTALIGAPRDDQCTHDPECESGSAYVFVRSGTSWSEQQKLIAHDLPVANDRFGSSLSLAGNTAVVGTYRDDDACPPGNPLCDSGAAYVFVRTGSTWSQQQKITASDAVAEDRFAFGVAALEDTVAAGAPYVDDAGLDAGSTYVYERRPTAGTPFCHGADSALALCPCSNPGAPETGCDNAQGTGGVKLNALGDVTSGSALLEGLGFPPNATPTVIGLRATSVEAQPVVFGDGLRCVGTPVVRFGATFASLGRSAHPVQHGAGPGSFHYQLWYRNTPVTFCDVTAAFNLSSAVSITWP